MTGSDPAWVEVRHATTADTYGLSELLDQLGYPTSPEHVDSQLKEAFANRGGVIVATEGARLVGFASYQLVYFFWDAASRCRLTALVVDDSSRKLGVGHKLLAEVEARARDAACSAIEVTGHHHHRDAAHRFYPTVGFAPAGSQVLYCKVLAPE